MPRLLKKIAVRTGLARLDPGVQKRLGRDYFYLRTYSSDVLSAPVKELELLEEAERAAHEAKSQTNETGASGGIIDLSQGMPDLSTFFPLSAILQEASLRNDAMVNLQKYPRAFGQPAALSSVARKITADTGVVYDPAHEILLCNGASQGLAHALECFVDPGEAVVLFDPCYMFYQWLAQTRGVRVRRVGGPQNDIAGRDPAMKDRLNQRDLERAMRGAKAIIINSPSNPDGSMIHVEDLKLIAALAARHNCIIISDEVYSGFCWSQKFTSIASIPAARSRTIIVSSLSKSHGLPGLRAGWCAGPAALIRPLGMLMSIRVPCVSAMVQEVLPALIEAESKFSLERHDQFITRRDSALFHAKTTGFTANAPDGAFYLWSKVPDGFSSGYDFARWCLEQCRVVVMPGEPFGPSGKGMFRYSWGGPMESFTTAMQRIQAFEP